MILVSQNSDRAVKAVPEADDTPDLSALPMRGFTLRVIVTTSAPIEETADTGALEEEDGPDVGPGRRATDLPCVGSGKVAAAYGCGRARCWACRQPFCWFRPRASIASSGVGLAFFAGGLAVWRLFADDMHRAIQAVQLKDEKIRRLMARCEELEDRAWELGESDERHASILATLGDVVIRRDQDGIITYVNSAADDVFGPDHHLQPGQLHGPAPGRG